MALKPKRLLLNWSLVLLQKLVWPTAERLGNSSKTIQGDVVLGALDTTNERPVHVGPFSKGFLRQTELMPKFADILPENLAVCVCHAPQVWRKMVLTNIGYATI